MAAKVYITEFRDMGVTGANQGYRTKLLAVPDYNLCIENASSPLTASGTAGASAAFSAGTVFIRIKTDGGGPINYKIGTSAVATTANAHMHANEEVYAAVKVGDVVSVIVSAA